MTIEDVKVIIRVDETRTVEMKKTTGELKDGMRSACAFLNTAGGWLFCVGHIQTRNHTTVQPYKFTPPLDRWSLARQEPHNPTS